MRFPYKVKDAKSIQKNFDYLSTLLTNLMGGAGAGNISIRFGTQNLTFTASTNSATNTFNHGLGKDPRFVVIQPYNAPGFGNIPIPNVGPTATQLNVNGEVKTAFTGTVPFFWLVIG